MNGITRNPLFRAACVVAVLCAVTVAILVIVKNTGGTGTDIPSAVTDGGLEQLDPLTGAHPEIHGVWIATAWNLNFPSRPGLPADELKKELDVILAEVAGIGGNAVFFQVRPSSDSLCVSDIFPVSRVLTGNEGDDLPDGFDPFEYLISAAHAQNIEVHAWVNPLRAASSVSEAEKASEKNPLKRHPEYTVTYHNALYYDCGLPEVRKLAADGVREICEKYDVDGVIFDDYFYPYPVENEIFDDAETYAKYGGGKNIGDFRRESVNELIKECYEAVKSVSKELRFGVAPFGIWKNDDGQNGGSKTSGLSSYDAICCDTLAWIKSGTVDYVAPQIYWQTGYEKADFRTLCDWWNEQVGRYGNGKVELMISHAAYRSAEWQSDREIREQIAYAGTMENYRGSIVYGYASVKDDEMALKAQLADAFEENVMYY